MTPKILAKKLEPKLDWPKSVSSEGWAPKGGPRRVGPEGWGAQNFALFLPFPATVSLFLCLSGLLVEFWWCLKRRGPEMCTFGVLWLSCASPGGPVWWGRQGLRVGNSTPSNHEDHIAGRGENSLQHYNLVHKFIPMPQAMKIPAAKAAVHKEWEKLEKISAWNLTEVRSKKQVIDEAKTSGAPVHLSKRAHFRALALQNTNKI